MSLDKQELKTMKILDTMEPTTKIQGKMGQKKRKQGRWGRSLILDIHLERWRSRSYQERRSSEEQRQRGRHTRRIIQPSDNFEIVPSLLIILLSHGTKFGVVTGLSELTGKDRNMVLIKSIHPQLESRS